ncbi:MAG: PucR family transcriptional regulator [Actinomycetes bacterium]
MTPAGLAAASGSGPDPAELARARATTVQRLERATAELSTAALAQMDATLAWYRAMPAESRSWVGLVAQAGVAAFVEWFRRPDTPLAVTADVFGTAPRELTRTVTLHQTVDLIRVVIDVVEAQVEQIAVPGAVGLLREAVLRYSREIAFAAAGVYARAAEARGAWDARLEALVVDGVLRGETDDAVRSRAAALGWGGHEALLAVVGRTPGGDPESVIDQVRRAIARAGHLDVLTGVQGDRLVLIVGGPARALHVRAELAAGFGPGPVVLGPVVSDLGQAHLSATEALAGLGAVSAWPDAPRPVSSEDLLAERALTGDPSAQARLVDEVYLPLSAAGQVLLETLGVVLEQASSLQAAARVLFVHPNTVRYRLRRIAEVTGYTPTNPRHALVLRLALILGRLRPTSHPEPPPAGTNRHDLSGTYK